MELVARKLCFLYCFTLRSTTKSDLMQVIQVQCCIDIIPYNMEEGACMDLPLIYLFAYLTPKGGWPLQKKHTVCWTSGLNGSNILQVDSIIWGTNNVMRKLYFRYCW